jgi:hypothetical protein
MSFVILISCFGIKPLTIIISVMNLLNLIGKTGISVCVQ